MRPLPILAITAMLLAMLAASGAATAGHRLDGWQKFKFGMTPDQARAVPGWSWGRYVNTSMVHVLSSLPMTSEFGPGTKAVLDFDTDLKLRTVNLDITASQSTVDCEKAFLTALTGLDAKYGAFGPAGEKDQWYVSGDTLNRQSLLEKTSARKLSGRQTRYWWRTFPSNVSGLNVEAQAHLSHGVHSINVSMYQKDAPNGCHRNINLAENKPSKEQLQRQLKLKHVPTDMDWHWAEVDRWTNGSTAISSGPVEPHFSTGPAEHVGLRGGRFTADMKRPSSSGPGGTIHLAGTISNNKISAHVLPSEVVSEDFPTSFEGYISALSVDGEPVDAYQISLTGKGRSGPTLLTMAAYHRSSPHTPTPEACRKTADIAFGTRGSSLGMTYRGLLQALGCPPP